MTDTQARLAALEKWTREWIKNWCRKHDHNFQCDFACKDGDRAERWEYTVCSLSQKDALITGTAESYAEALANTIAAIHGKPADVEPPVSDNDAAEALDAVFAAQRHTDHQNALLAGFTRAALTGLIIKGDTSIATGAVEFAKATLQAFNQETTPCPTDPE